MNNHRRLFFRSIAAALAGIFALRNVASGAIEFDADCYLAPLPLSDELKAAEAERGGPFLSATDAMNAVRERRKRIAYENSRYREVSWSDSERTKRAMIDASHKLRSIRLG